ncbi:hypothetical protein Hanom_Chr02g00146091 [Helianthus anomalus]
MIKARHIHSISFLHLIKNTNKHFSTHVTCHTNGNPDINTSLTTRPLPLTVTELPKYLTIYYLLYIINK